MTDNNDSNEDKDQLGVSQVFQHHSIKSVDSKLSHFIYKLTRLITGQTINYIVYVLLRIPLIIVYDYLLSDVFTKRVETYLDNPVEITEENQKNILYAIISFLQNIPLKMLVKINLAVSIPLIGLIVLICLLLSTNRSLMIMHSHIISLWLIYSFYNLHRRAEPNIFIFFVEVLHLFIYIFMFKLRPRMNLNWIQIYFCFFTVILFINDRFFLIFNLSFNWINVFYLIWMLLHLAEVFVFRGTTLLNVARANCVEPFLVLYTAGGLQRVCNYLYENIPVTRLLKIFWCTKLLIGPLGIRYLCTSPSLHQAIYKFSTISDQLNKSKEQEIYQDFSWLSILHFTMMFHGTETILCLISLACLIGSIISFISYRIFRFIDLWADTVEQIGTLTAVIFFLLAFQSNLMSIDLNLRHIPILKAIGLLPVAISSFLHTILEPVLLKMAMQMMLRSTLMTQIHEIQDEKTCETNQSRYRKFSKIVYCFQNNRVYQCLGMIVVLLIYMICLWRMTKFSTWLITVSGFILELVIRSIGSLIQYSLYILDGHGTFKDNDDFDEYIFRTKTVTSCCEFILGVCLLFNGFYVLVFEAPNVVRAVILVAHTNLNIIKKSKRGWKLLNNRRSASDKVNHLRTPTRQQIEDYDSVCSICLSQLIVDTSCVTPCAHLFHRKCLQKAFYANQNCPLCSQVISSANVNYSEHHRD